MNSGSDVRKIANDAVVVNGGSRIHDDMIANDSFRLNHSSGENNASRA
jgi:hypothetical protein